MHRVINALSHTVLELCEIKIIQHVRRFLSHPKKTEETNSDSLSIPLPARHCLGLVISSYTMVHGTTVRQMYIYTITPCLGRPGEPWQRALGRKIGSIGEHHHLDTRARELLSLLPIDLHSPYSQAERQSLEWILERNQSGCVSIIQYRTAVGYA